jgi:hypothetical protein
MVNTPPVNTPSPAPAPAVALPIIIFSPYEKTLDMNGKDSVNPNSPEKERISASSLTTSPLALHSAIGLR